MEAAEMETKKNVVDTCLKDIHPQMVKLLAAQKLAENPRMTNLIAVPPLPTAQEKRPSMRPAQRSTRLTPILTLVHLNDGQIIELQQRSIDIGIGANNTLDLGKLGSCERASAHHATIFHDQISARWELLNYGEFGTLVNGVMYGCDVSHFDGTSKPDDETLRHFKEVVDQRKKTLLEQRTQQGNRENLQAILKRVSSN